MGGKKRRSGGKRAADLDSLGVPTPGTAAEPAQVPVDKEDAEKEQINEIQFRIEEPVAVSASDNALIGLTRTQQVEVSDQNAPCESLGSWPILLDNTNDPIAILHPIDTPAIAYALPSSTIAQCSSIQGDDKHETAVLLTNSGRDMAAGMRDPLVHDSDESISAQSVIADVGAILDLEDSILHEIDDIFDRLDIERTTINIGLSSAEAKLDEAEARFKVKSFASPAMMRSAMSPPSRLPSQLSVPSNTSPYPPPRRILLETGNTSPESRYNPLPEFFASKKIIEQRPSLVVSLGVSDIACTAFAGAMSLCRRLLFLIIIVDICLYSVHIKLHPKDFSCSAHTCLTDSPSPVTRMHTASFGVNVPQANPSYIDAMFSALLHGSRYSITRFGLICSWLPERLMLDMIQQDLLNAVSYLDLCLCNSGLGSNNVAENIKHVVVNEIGCNAKDNLDAGSSSNSYNFTCIVGILSSISVHSIVPSSVAINSLNDISFHPLNVSKSFVKSSWQDLMLDPTLKKIVIGDSITVSEDCCPQLLTVVALSCLADGISSDDVIHTGNDFRNSESTCLHPPDSRQFSFPNFKYTYGGGLRGNEQYSVVIECDRPALKQVVQNPVYNKEIHSEATISLVCFGYPIMTVTKTDKTSFANSTISDGRMDSSPYPEGRSFFHDVGADIVHPIVVYEHAESSDNQIAAERVHSDADPIAVEEANREAVQVLNAIIEAAVVTAQPDAHRTAIDELKIESGQTNQVEQAGADCKDAMMTKTSADLIAAEESNAEASGMNEVALAGAEQAQTHSAQSCKGKMQAATEQISVQIAQADADLIGTEEIITETNKIVPELAKVNKHCARDKAMADVACEAAQEEVLQQDFINKFGTDQIEGMLLDFGGVDLSPEDLFLASIHHLGHAKLDGIIFDADLKTAAVVHEDIGVPKTGNMKNMPGDKNKKIEGSHKNIAEAVQSETNLLTKVFSFLLMLLLSIFGYVSFLIYEATKRNPPQGTNLTVISPYRAVSEPCSSVLAEATTDSDVNSDSNPSDNGRKVVAPTMMKSDTDIAPAPQSRACLSGANSFESVASPHAFPMKLKGNEINAGNESRNISSAVTVSKDNSKPLFRSSLFGSLLNTSPSRNNSSFVENSGTVSINITAKPQLTEVPASISKAIIPQQKSVAFSWLSRKSEHDAESPVPNLFVDPIENPQISVQSSSDLRISAADPSIIKSNPWDEITHGNENNSCFAKRTISQAQPLLNRYDDPREGPAKACNHDDAEIKPHVVQPSVLSWLSQSATDADNATVIKPLMSQSTSNSQTAYDKLSKFSGKLEVSADPEARLHNQKTSSFFQRMPLLSAMRDDKEVVDRFQDSVDEPARISSPKFQGLSPSVIPPKLQISWDNIVVDDNAPRNAAHEDRKQSSVSIDDVQRQTNLSSSDKINVVTPSVLSWINRASSDVSRTSSPPRSNVTEQLIVASHKNEGIVTNGQRKLQLSWDDIDIDDTNACPVYAPLQKSTRPSTASYDDPRQESNVNFRDSSDLKVKAPFDHIPIEGKFSLNATWDSLASLALRPIKGVSDSVKYKDHRQRFDALELQVGQSGKYNSLFDGKRGHEDKSNEALIASDPREQEAILKAEEDAHRHIAQEAMMDALPPEDVFEARETILSKAVDEEERMAPRKVIVLDDKASNLNENLPESSLQYHKSNNDERYANASQIVESARPVPSILNVVSRDQSLFQTDPTRSLSSGFFSSSFVRRLNSDTDRDQNDSPSQYDISRSSQKNLISNISTTASSRISDIDQSSHRQISSVFPQSDLTPEEEKTMARAIKAAQEHAKRELELEKLPLHQREKARAAMEKDILRGSQGNQSDPPVRAAKEVLNKFSSIFGKRP